MSACAPLHCLQDVPASRSTSEARRRPPREASLTHRSGQPASGHLHFSHSRSTTGRPNHEFTISLLLLPPLAACVNQALRISEARTKLCSRVSLLIPQRQRFTLHPPRTPSRRDIGLPAVARVLPPAGSATRIFRRSTSASSECLRFVVCYMVCEFFLGDYRLGVVLTVMRQFVLCKGPACGAL